MKKCISYSLFGYGRPQVSNSFTFVSYLRGLLLSIRMDRILFPNWEIVVNMDKETYEAYKPLFDTLPIVVCVNDPEPLTKAMLWRMRPVFNYSEYSHVICRDLDSPPTYREAQCVQEWINSDMGAHAITDSISHGVPLLGGMIGFNTGYFPMITGMQHWTDLFHHCNLDFSQKGADQTLLNSLVYPKFADPPRASIMQHYLLGMPNTFLPGYRNVVPNIEVENVPKEMEESNESCSHMGQAGWLLPQTFRFFRKHADKMKDLLDIEKNWPDIAYWVKDGTFD